MGKQLPPFTEENYKIIAKRAKSRHDEMVIECEIREKRAREENTGIKFVLNDGYPPPLKEIIAEEIENYYVNTVLQVMYKRESGEENGTGTD